MKNENILKIATECLINRKILILLLMIFKTCSVGLGIFVPFLVGDVIDNIDKISIFKIALLIILSFVSLVIESIVTYQFTLLGKKASIHVRNKLCHKILSLDVQYYDKIHSGELSSRIIHDTSSLSEFLTASLPDLYSSILTLILMISILISYDKWLGGIFCIIFPIIILIMIPLANKISDLAIIQQGIYAKLNEILTETLEHIRFVKAYNAERSEEKKVLKKMDEWFLNSQKYNMIQAILSPLMGGITTLGLFVVCGIGAYRVQMGFVTTGTIIIFALYLVNAVEPVEIIGNIIMEYKELQGALYKVSEIFDVESEKTDGIPLNNKIKKLSFYDVKFSYNREKVLNGITFVANQNEKIAIVGESGAGKTTIFSLIERFYNVKEGKIVWGINSINDIQLNEWRNNIGYVFQDKIIISGTVKENLLYGIEREVCEKELIQAAKKANIYETIMTLKYGFDTYIGEKGELLSGGQKQKLAIARMFLKNPAVLLLDEITASLDAESEQQISKSLNNLYIGRITLIIAHKLHTVMDADRILVLKNGKLVGEGNHEELMKTNNYYQGVIKYEFKT